MLLLVVVMDPLSIRIDLNHIFFIPDLDVKVIC